MVKQLLSILTLALLGTSLIIMTPTKVDAFSGSDFKAGRITDDAIFFSGNDLTINEIQSFMNAKTPVCDTWGTQQYGSTTRAQYAASLGVSTPFICLKDYRQTTTTKAAETGLCNTYNGASNQSSAEIIYRVSEACGISSKALLVLLQKEQSLLTDDWPWPIQYRSATGYGCPDTAPCDAEYYGFFNQVYSAARQFKRYARDSSSFNYRPFRNNNIQFNPNASCGSSSVYIENQATAGLYNYTPYQPNQAALNNLYGVGDSCSAYGNRNYWRIHYDWFGNPVNNAYAWEVIKEPGQPKLYFVSNKTKYYIPGPSVNTAWGLDKYPYREVDSYYFNSLPSGPNMNYVALDVNGGRYLMSSGKKHYLSSDSHVLAWGLAGVPHIPAAGLMSQTTSGGNAGRFASSEGVIYLMNGDVKHVGATAQSLSYGGYSSSQTTPVTSDIANRLPNGPAIDRYIQIGNIKYVIDSGRKLNLTNTAIAHAWGNQSYTNTYGYAASLIPSTAASTFIRANNDSKWYFIESGKKHYVPSSSHADVWGWGVNNPLLVISPELVAQFTTSSNLGYSAYSTTTGKHYVINRSKHWIPNPNMLSQWMGDQATPGFSEESLSLLPNGIEASSTLIGFSGHPHIYALNEGKLAHIPSFNVLDAVGGNRNNRLFTASASLNNLISKQGSIKLVVKDSIGNSYYLENGYRYPLDPTHANSWGVNTAPIVSGYFLNSMSTKPTSLGFTLGYGGRYYIMNKSSMIDVSNDYSNYGLTTGDFSQIERLYFPVVSSSHLLGLSGNGKIWLLSSGRRYHIPSFGMLLDLGYGTTSNINTLDQNIINTLPEDASKAHRVLRASTTGAIFASQGKGLGFGDSVTLSSYLGDRSPLIIPTHVFNKFVFSGWTTRITIGTDGKVYLIDGGNKRWITSPAVLWQNYGNIPWTQLSQPSIDAFSTGSNI